jgi:alcohol dehydrogenase
MVGMPKSLTAATGMDALTHAIEAYVSTAATPITDACALKAISLISATCARRWPTAATCRPGRHGAQFRRHGLQQCLPGYVHAMAHQLGGYYDLHGVQCRAAAHVQRFNAKTSAARLRRGQGHGRESLRAGGGAGAGAAISAIEHLAVAIGIPAGLAELGAKVEDVPVLAANALKDACGLTNPRVASQAEIEAIFKAAF